MLVLYLKLIFVPKPRSIYCILLCSLFFLTASNSLLGQNSNELLEKAEELDWLIIRGQAEEALEISDSILSELKGNLTEDYYSIYFHKGKSLEFLMRYVESMEIMHDLISKTKKSGQYELEAKSYLSLARIYDNLGRKDECYENLLNAKSVIEKADLKYILSEYCVRYASYQRFYGDLDSCFYYAERGIEYAYKYENYKVLPDCYLLLGLSVHDPKEKVEYYKKAASLYKSLNNCFGAATQYLNVVKTNNILGNFEETKHYLDSAKYCIEILNEREYKSSTHYFIIYKYHYELGQYYYAINEPDSALLYLNKSIVSKEDMELNEIKENVAKYELDIALLKEQEEKKYLKAISNYLIFGLIIISIVTILLTFVLKKNTNKNKIIKKNNDIIIEQNKDLATLYELQKKLLSEVHHRVKNNLQLVISLITIKANSYESLIFKEAMEDINSKIQSMALIHEQLYKVGDFSSIHLKTYLINLVDYFKDILRNEHPIDIKMNIEENINLNIETTQPLGIIIVELLHNSIKHAKPSQDNLIIHLNLVKIGESYDFTYKDNGSVYLSDRKGLGTMLIENMGRQLNGEVNITTNEGFVYTLKIKEKFVSPISLNFGNTN